MPDIPALTLDRTVLNVTTLGDVKMAERSVYFEAISYSVMRWIYRIALIMYQCVYLLLRGIAGNVGPRPAEKCAAHSYRTGFLEGV